MGKVKWNREFNAPSTGGPDSRFSCLLVNVGRFEFTNRALAEIIAAAYYGSIETKIRKD